MSHTCVIGIGCSAGGVEALKKVVGSLPQVECPYLFVQHLSPKHESMMVKILERLTDLPVVEAQHGDELSGKKIYVTPPGQLISIKKGRVQLEKINEETDRTPLHTLDTFFKSLAEDCGDRGIAVVLSGSGSDGVRGCRAIKEAGGTVIAQNPDTAQFKSMPQTIVSAGLADLVVNLEDLSSGINSAIAQFSKEKKILQDSTGSASSDFDKTISLISKKSGINFSRYKNSTLKRRISKRMAINKLDDFDSYYNYLLENDKELNLIAKEFLIGVTSFFRDPDNFEQLNETVVSELVKQVDKNGEIRVWVPACSTGEEAYTIAMLLEDAKTKSDKFFEYRIFASDIDQRAITVAQSGVYPGSLINDIPSHYKHSYLDEISEDEYRVIRKIRDRIVFSKHDIISDPPFGRMDLISFRNCSIYLNKTTQLEILTILEHSLKLSGYLFLGKSESIPKNSTMEVTNSTAKIYKKTSKRLVQNKFDVLKIQNNRLKEQPTRPKSVSDRDELFLELGHQMFSELLPPSIIIDQDGKLLHIFGDVSPFTKMRAGAYDGRFYDFIHEDLRAPLQTSFKRLQQNSSDIEVQKEPTKFTVRHFGEKSETVKVEIKPFQPRSYDQVYLIAFRNIERNVEKNASTPENDGDSEEEIKQLRGELDQSRKDLDFTVENLETANEELQSTNEELVTSNEELQSTNEELQSVNEELHTMNAEFQDKIDELSQVNRDMETLLKVSNVGTLFVDNDLSIRKISDQAMRVMNLREGDIGRSIKQFNQPLYEQFISDCEKVLNSHKAIEHQVKIEHFGTALIKIHPYTSYEGQREGLVILMINVSEIRSHQDSHDWLLRFLLSSNEVSFSVDVDGKIDFWSKAAEKFFNLKSEEILGQDETALLPLKAHADIKLIHQYISNGQPIYLNKTYRLDGEGESKKVTLIANGRYGERGKLIGCHYTLFPLENDTKEVNQAKKELKWTRLLLDNNPTPTFFVNEEGVIEYANKALCEVTERTPEDIYSMSHSAQSWGARNLDNSPVEENQTLHHQVITLKKPVHNKTFKILTGKSEHITVQASGTPLFEEDRLVGAVFSLLKAPEELSEARSVNETQSDSTESKNM